MNNYKPNSRFAPLGVASPNKIRSIITPNNFRKFRPTPVVPAVVKVPIHARPQPNRTIQRQQPQPQVIAKPTQPAHPPVQPIRSEVKTMPQNKLQGKFVKPTKVQQKPPQPHRQIKPQVQAVRYPKDNKRNPPPSSKTTSSITRLKDTGKGRILLMLAAGPSINEVDFSLIKDHQYIDVMCINQPYTKLWPTKYWGFCDHTQQRRNEEVWNNYSGIIFNSFNVRARKSNQFLIGSKSGRGFSTDVSTGYHIGRSSTYANMQVAYYLGYDKIYIFGCDMAGVNGVMHYYGQNPDVNNEQRAKRFAAEAESYTWAGMNMPPEVRSKFVFCSSYNPWPFLKFFTKMDHKTAIPEIVKIADSYKNTQEAANEKSRI